MNEQDAAVVKAHREQAAYELRQAISKGQRIKELLGQKVWLDLQHILSEAQSKLAYGSIIEDPSQIDPVRANNVHMFNSGAFAAIGDFIKTLERCVSDCSEYKEKLEALEKIK